MENVIPIRRKYFPTPVDCAKTGRSGGIWCVCCFETGRKTGVIGSKEKIFKLVSQYKEWKGFHYEKPY